MPDKVPKNSPGELTYPNWDLLVIDPNMKPISNLKMIFHVDGKEVPLTTNAEGKAFGIPRSNRQIQIDATYKGKKEQIHVISLMPEDSLDNNLITIMSPFILLKSKTVIHDGTPGQPLTQKPSREEPVVKTRNEAGHPTLQAQAPSTPVDVGNTDSLLKIAATWVDANTPYVRGGITREGADCSGSTWAIFRENGMSYKQIAVNGSNAAGITANPNFTKVIGDPLPGDVAYYAKPSHVCIYAGNGKIYTAHHPGGDPYSLTPMNYFSKATPTFYRYHP